MTNTVIGVFRADKLGHVRRELIEAGIKERDLDLIEGEERAVLEAVRARGFGDGDAQAYADAAKSGRRLLAAKAEDGRRMEEIVGIMERYEGDGDEDAGERRQGKDQDKGQGRKRGDEPVQAERLQIVEEELEVGKSRRVQGGVRAPTHVTERPVEERVRLREEHVEVDRKPVARRLDQDEADTAFQERTVEMTETAEEVEVAKEARVVEEITLRKTAEEHEERVRDTVRRTEVEVERLKPGRH